MKPCDSTFEPADRIVIAASRSWVRGYEPWQASVRGLSRHFDPVHGRVFAFHLGALLAVLASAGNERIVIGPVGSPAVWPGEAVLLDAVALCRNGCKPDALLARYLGPAARRLALYHLHGVVASLDSALGRARRPVAAGSAGAARVLPFPAAARARGG